MKKLLKTALTLALASSPLLLNNIDPAFAGDPFATAEDAVTEGLAGFRSIANALAVVGIIGAIIGWYFGKVSIARVGYILVGVLVIALAPSMVEWINGFGS